MNSQLHSSLRANKAFSLETAQDAHLLSLKNLKDAELLSCTKMLVQREREITTEVLRHLAEIERRKLYCDLRYPSLFEYAIRELGYSESAAGRRIAAMRLIKELPELEEKIESGALNLSNICQAQKFFREQKKSTYEQPLSKPAKLEILEKLEQKSAREGERILFEIGGTEALPRERERIVSAELVELSFLANQKLKAQLEDVRALLGSRGAQMNLAELVAEMAKLSVERLSEQKFGKRRIRIQTARDAKAQGSTMQLPERAVAATDGRAIPENFTPDVGSDLRAQTKSVDGLSDDAQVASNRYIPRVVKHQVWRKSQGQCSCCGSKRDLQFDHVQPFALRGNSSANNIRLLCRSCNIRRGVQRFGTTAMKR